MAARVQGGVDVVFEAPRWSERWVLEDDVTMPESSEHRLTCELLEDVLRAWVARTSRDAVVYANLAVRWDEQRPRIGVDPDVCVVEPAPADPRVRSLRTWEPSHPAPRVAVEVVSDTNANKDYGESPAKYAVNGTRELWVFDPERRGTWMGGPWLLQVWARAEGGAFRRVYAGDGPVRSEELGAWLVVTDQGARLRIADDEAGDRLWLTEAETERVAKEVERAAKEAAQAEADALRAEVARLKALLAR